MTASPSIKLLNSILLTADEEPVAKKKKNVRCYSLDLSMIEQEEEILSPFGVSRAFHESKSGDNYDFLEQWGQTIEENLYEEEFYERDDSIEPIAIERRISRKWPRQDNEAKFMGLSVNRSEESNRLQIAMEQREQLSTFIPSIAKEIEMEAKNDMYITNSFQLQANIIDHLERYIEEISLPAVEVVDELKNEIVLERRKSQLEMNALNMQNAELNDKIEKISAANQEAESKVESMKAQFTQVLQENEIKMQPDEFVDDQVMELEQALEVTQTKLSSVIEEAEAQTNEKAQLEDILNTFYDKIGDLTEERDFVRSQISKCEKMLWETQEELRIRNEEVHRIRSEKELDQRLSQEFLDAPADVQPDSTEIVEIPFDAGMDENDLPESYFSIVQDDGVQIYSLNDELEVEEYANSDDVWLEEDTPEPVITPTGFEPEPVATSEDLVEEVPQHDEKKEKKASSQRDVENTPIISMKEIPELLIEECESVTILGTHEQKESTSILEIAEPINHFPAIILTLAGPIESIILPEKEKPSPTSFSERKEKTLSIPVMEKTSPPVAMPVIKSKSAPPVNTRAKPTPVPPLTVTSKEKVTLKQTQHLRMLQKRKIRRQRMGARDFSEALSLFQKLEKENPGKVKPTVKEKPPIVKDMISMLKSSSQKKDMISKLKSSSGKKVPHPEKKATRKVVARVRKKRKHHFLNPRRKGYLKIPHSFQFSRKRNLQSGHKFYVCLDALPCRPCPKPNEQFWEKDRKNADLRPCIFWFENQAKFASLQMATAGMHVRSKEFQTKFTEFVLGLVVMAAETSAINSVEHKAIERLRNLTGRTVTLMPGFLGFAKPRSGTEADFYLLVKSWDRDSYVSHKFRAESSSVRDTWIFRIRKFLNRRLQHSRAISSAFMSMGDTNPMGTLDKITKGSARGTLSIIKGKPKDKVDTTKDKARVAEIKEKLKVSKDKNIDRSRGASVKTQERSRARHNKALNSTAQQKKEHDSDVKTSPSSYKRGKKTSPKIVIPLNNKNDEPALAIKLCVDQLFDVTDTKTGKRAEIPRPKSHRSKKLRRTGGTRTPERSGGRSPARSGGRTPNKSGSRTPDRSSASSRASDKSKRIRRKGSPQKVSRDKKIERGKSRSRIK